MFCTLWLLLLAVLAVSANSPAQKIQRVKRTVPNTPFITIEDGQFFVNGSVFNAIGTNAYWLSALNSEQDIDNTLASIRAANFTVVRTWAFNDVDDIPESGTWFQLVNDGAQSINTGANGLQKLDKVIELAQNHGLYVLLSLTNNWNPSLTDPNSSPDPDQSNTILPRNTLSNSYGGMDTYVRNFGGPQEHDQFFTNQTLIQAFMDYTSHVVTRYMNKTNVFAWELANDPQCNSTLPNNPSCTPQDLTLWHSQISRHVSMLDPNHAISSGTQGFLCLTCPKVFSRALSQSLSAPGSRRNTPEPQSKAKLLKETRQPERQEHAGIEPDGVNIRGRWTASQTKRQFDLNNLMSAFDGSHGVDSADILAIPQIGFSSFQLFPDQFDYSSNLPDMTLPPFNRTLQIGMDWIELHADLAALFNKPVICTGFGLTTQNNARFFVPFNLTEAPFGPNSPTPMNSEQLFGVTEDQRNDAYQQWIQSAVLAGVQGVLQYQWGQSNLTTEPGTAISPSSNETPESPLSNMTGTSPNDGYTSSGQSEEEIIASIFKVYFMVTWFIMI